MVCPIKATPLQDIDFFPFGFSFGFGFSFSLDTNSGSECSVKWPLMCPSVGMCTESDNITQQSIKINNFCK